MYGASRRPSCAPIIDAPTASARPPPLPDDHRRAHGFAPLPIAYQKYVFAAPRVLDLPEEALLRHLQQPRDVTGLVRQVDGVEVAGKLEQSGEVGRHCPADLVFRHEMSPQN